MLDAQDVEVKLVRDRHYWQSQLTAWQASGQSQQAYCREQHIAPSSFKYWKAKLLGQPDKGNDSSTTSRSAAFIPVQGRQSSGKRFADAMVDFGR